MRKLLSLIAVLPLAAEAHPDHAAAAPTLWHRLSEPDHAAAIMLGLVVAGAVVAGLRARR